MEFVDKIEIVGVLGAASVANQNGQLRFWEIFGPVPAVSVGWANSQQAASDQGSNIWETDRAVGPPQKVGSNILAKLTSALQNLIRNGILNCPLPLDCESDITDVEAVRDVLQEIKEALEIAWEEHEYFHRQLMTSYLTRNPDEVHRLTWVMMSYSCLPEDYLSSYLLGDSAGIMRRFESTYNTLYPTVARFHAFITEWSGIYRNGESLNQLEMIHVILTQSFGEVAAEWRQVIQSFRKRLNSKEVMDAETIRQRLAERLQFLQNMTISRVRRCSDVSISTDGGSYKTDSAYDSEFSNSPTNRPRLSESEESTSTNETLADTSEGTLENVVLSGQNRDEAQISPVPMYDPLEPLAALKAFADLSLLD